MNYTYILRRILIFIPTMFAISLIAFIISINAPGDPVEAFFEGIKGNKPGTEAGNKVEADKKALRHELGLDLPLFYVTISSLAQPDTLYKVGNAGERENLDRLIERYGNWDDISEWYAHLQELKVASGRDVAVDSVVLAQVSADSVKYITAYFYNTTLSLLLTNDPIEIQSKLDYLWKEFNRFYNRFGSASFLHHISAPLGLSRASFEHMESGATVWKNYIPTLHFYGFNQYHRWLFGDGNMFTGAGSEYSAGVIRGDFGRSYSTKLPVTETISSALPWSAFFTLVSVILAYIISIPIGVQAAAKRGGWFDRTSSVILFMLYSMPPFLMGIVLLLLLANPDTWNIFPANGIEPATGIDPSSGWWDRTMIRLPYLVLPIICYTYGSIAFLSRTVRVAMLEVNTQDFMRTARSKGLGNRLLYYRHGLSNALLPVITVFANVFPAAIGGSVVLEYLFGIPGMGQEILAAVNAGDFSMIVAVFTLTGFMTLIGYLIADILYSIADPRISFDRK